VYIYSLEPKGGVVGGSTDTDGEDDSSNTTWMETQRLTSPAVSLAGYEPGTDADGDNVTAAELFGSAVVLADELLVVAAPGMYDGLGAVFVYEWVDDLHALDPTEYGDRDGYASSVRYRHFSFEQRLVYPGLVMDGGNSSSSAVREYGFGLSVAATGSFIVVALLAGWARQSCSRAAVIRRSSSGHRRLAARTSTTGVTLARPSRCTGTWWLSPRASSQTGRKPPLPPAPPPYSW
jgi:hypothetical protein